MIAGGQLLGVQSPKMRLLVSPVVPVLEIHIGSSVVPLIISFLTVIRAPELKTAAVPLPLPNTLNSEPGPSMSLPWQNWIAGVGRSQTWFPP
jgi:hypothetical protein